MEETDKLEVEQMIQEAIAKASNFSTRKIGDTPTDTFQLTPRKYVNMNGSIAARPVGSIASIGQFFLSTDLPTPAWFTGSKWVNGVGSVVAS